MAPKKAAASNEAGETGGKFTWEGANDNKLLLLTQGRYVKPEEYPQLSSAFTGVTIGSIRNRISALRVKQRDLYESLGWDLPSGGATHSAKKAKGGKRNAEEDSAGEAGTPSKKPRSWTKKVKEVEVNVKKEVEFEGDEEGDEEGEGEGEGEGERKVKQEKDDDEDVEEK